jgi:hypothetical protein
VSSRTFRPTGLCCTPRLFHGIFALISYAFVRDALLDERAKKQNLCPLIPDSVPSGYSTMIFEECH